MEEGYDKNTIESLREKLSNLNNVSESDKMGPILMSKSLSFLSGEIATLKESINGNIEKINGGIKDMIASNSRLTIANRFYSVVMIFLTAAIAFSALVQAGIIDFNK